MTVVSQPRLVLVGRYRLDAPLGQSSDGWFCQAHDLVQDRPVMVKMFKSTVDEVTARSFAKEAKSLADLRHDHLVSLYDGGVADGHPYVVLEPIDGFDLLDAACERPLSAADTATLGAGLADALAQMHAEGIVHGNLTPGSVLIDADGRRRLIGLGFGRGNEDCTAPADVHALGLVLLRCVTGPDAERLEGTIPGPLARVLTAMTGRNSADRPSAEACVRRLSRAAHALETDRRPSKGAVAQRDWVAGLAAVGGLATVAVIAFSPTSMPEQQAGPPAAVPVPTVLSQVPLPDPTVTTTPKQPGAYPPPTASRVPTTSVRPTRSAPPTTDAPPPATVSTVPTTTAPTTTDPTTTEEDAPPGLAKKSFGLPPGLVRKLLWLDQDHWGWLFGW